MKKKITAIIALILVVAAAIGGTYAYLTAESDEKTNTFTFGNIGTLDLKETKTSFEIIPGTTLDKDPQIKYTQGTNPIDAYLYVKIGLNGTNGWTKNADGTITHKIGTQTTGLSFKVTDSWIDITPAGVTDYAVFVYTTDKSTAAKVQNTMSDYVQVMTNGQATPAEGIWVSGNVKASDVSGESVNALVIRAYAVQAAGFEADGSKTAAQVAWESTFGAAT